MAVVGGFAYDARAGYVVLVGLDGAGQHELLGTEYDDRLTLGHTRGRGVHGDIAQGARHPAVPRDRGELHSVPDEARDIGERGRKRALAEHTLRHRIEEMLSVMDRLA